MTADPLKEGITQARQAIDAGRLGTAHSMVESLLIQAPDKPVLLALGAVIDRGREHAVQQLRARLVAARAVNDPVQVIEARDELHLLLESDAQRAA